MNKELMKRAVVLFPRRDYTDASNVRHARRQWLRSIVLMRSGSQSLWVLDKKIFPQKVEQ